MRDQRIMEMIEGRLLPQVGDIPLVEHVFWNDLSFYDSDEREKIRAILRGLLHAQCGQNRAAGMIAGFK